MYIITENYHAPHKFVAKTFRALSKIVKKFSYSTQIRSARVAGIKNGRSLSDILSECFEANNRFIVVGITMGHDEEGYVNM